jgi:hypothetical protein
MPELVNIRVGSLPGTRGLDATTVWPLDSKKSRKVLRMSETEMGAWLMVIRAFSATGHYRFEAGPFSGSHMTSRPLGIRVLRLL